MGLAGLVCVCVCVCNVCVVCCVRMLTWPAVRRCTGGRGARGRGDGAAASGDGSGDAGDAGSTWSSVPVLSAHACRAVSILPPPPPSLFPSWRPGVSAAAISAARLPAVGSSIGPLLGVAWFSRIPRGDQAKCFGLQSMLGAWTELRSPGSALPHPTIHTHTLSLSLAGVSLVKKIRRPL